MTTLIIFAILMLPGIVGVILPALPGIPYMFLVALAFGIYDKFRHLVWWEMLVLLLLTLLSVAVDVLSGMIGARYGGAGRRAALFGILGFVAGLIVFPPFGGFIGLFVGVLAAEYLRHRESMRAVRAATGSLIGSVVGIVVNFFLAVLFVVLFLVFGMH